MVKDVLRRTPRVTYFHLGGDEALTLGSHPETKAYIERHGRAELYLAHIEPLLDLLLAQNIRPILWHDMMNDWPAEQLARLRDKADVMVWSYQGHPDLAPPAYNSNAAKRLHDAGVALWGATAFKGADGAGDGDLPDTPARVANAQGWMDVAPRHEMKGVAATGWSRYATNRVQCEPIEGALDALLQVAIVLHDGEPSTDDAWKELLTDLGEWDAFNRSRQALVDFRDARRAMWQCVLRCSEQLSLERCEPRRRGSGAHDELQRIARVQLASVQAAAVAVCRALEGLVINDSLESYVVHRSSALINAITSLPHRAGRYH